MELKLNKPVPEGMTKAEAKAPETAPIVTIASNEGEKFTLNPKAFTMTQSAADAHELQELEPIEPEMVSYTSFPVQRFSIGTYEFADGLLKLTPEQAEVFDALIATADHRTRNMVKKIDAKAAEAHFLATRAPMASKANDSSIESNSTAPIIGTQPVV